MSSSDDRRIGRARDRHRIDPWSRTPWRWKAQLEIVWATTLLLAFTHWFAVSIAARLVPDPADHHSPLEVLGAEMSIASEVALAATAVVVVAPSGYERLGARLTAAVGITLIVGLELLAGGSSRWRAAGSGFAALVLGSAIAATRWFIVMLGFDAA